jgi:stage V sporulation protein AE
MELFLACLKSFLVGGAICAVGQVLVDYTKITPARILFSFVVAGVVLGAVGLYQPFADWAGYGATVPLTGFGNLLAQGVKEAVKENGLLGAFTGGLTAASGGIAAAIFFGLLAAACFKPNDKNSKFHSGKK